MNRCAVIALSLVVAACSGGVAETTTSTTTTSTTTTTATSTTTTTTTTTLATTTTADPRLVTIAPEGFRSPVNGLQPAFDAMIDRRALAIKIDNHPGARPQSGLQEADAVVEFLVEGGFTRFMAVFHMSDAEYLGPVRSLRPTDSTIAAAIPAPIVMSGGQPWVQSLTTSRGVALMGESSQGMFRVTSRVAPHNLYADTNGLRLSADARSISNDPPQWIYRVGEWYIPDAPATTVALSWSSQSSVTWKYVNGVYERWIGTSPQVDRTRSGDTTTISVDVLVILTGREYTAYSHTDQGSPVPATNTVGSDRAYVISRGGVWEGTWTRDEITDQFVLTGADGNEVVVPPGRAWVSIYPNDRPITIS